MADLFIPHWMRNTPMEQVYIDAWVETGDPQLAREAVRESPEYDSFFAGNRRDDGSVRYEEGVYLSIVESFEDAILSIGLNPDLFAARFGEMIAGEVSPSEFVSRVENVYERVIDAVPEVRASLDEFYGVGLTDEAVLASFLDPDVGSAILEKRITMAEIGAEASTRGFSIARDFANRLYEAGTDTQSGAAQFFGLAENILPTLGVLAARHADPDDDFTLEQFAAAEVFGRVESRRRIRQLLAQERSTFAGAPELAVTRQSGGVLGGGLTGLVEA